MRRNLKKIRAFTLIELIVALVLLLSVVAFVAFAALNYLREQTEVRSAAEQFSEYETARARITRWVDEALFVTSPAAAGTDFQFALGRLHVDGTPFNANNSDALFTFSPPTGKYPIYEAINITCSASGCAQITLADRATPGATIGLAAGDYVYFVEGPESMITEVRAVNGDQLELKPALPLSFSNAGAVGAETPVLSIRVIPRVVFSHPAGDSPEEIRVAEMTPQEFETARTDDEIDIEDVSDRLLSRVESFFVSYELENKQTADFNDPCDPSITGFVNPSRFVDAAEPATKKCNYNNISRVNFELSFFPTVRSEEADNQEDLVREVWSTIPQRFDPSNSSATDINLQDANASCRDADTIEKMRCRSDCVGYYTNPDWEPGSDYCTCVDGPGSPPGAGTAETFENDRFEACCNHLDAQMAANPAANPCREFSTCSEALRADNPYLGVCKAPEVCGPNPTSGDFGTPSYHRELQVCLWGEISEVAAVCEKEGGTDSVGGKDIERPPNPKIVTLSELRGLGYDVDGQMRYPTKTGPGGLFHEGEDRGIISYPDSERCRCLREIYLSGGRPVERPDTDEYKAIYPPAEDNWTGSFTYENLDPNNKLNDKNVLPRHGIASRLDDAGTASLQERTIKIKIDDDGVKVISTNDTGEDYTYEDRRELKDYQQCWDPIYTPTSEGGEDSVCNFSFNGDKLIQEDAVIDDAITGPWMSDYLPGFNRYKGKADKFSRFIPQCGCERAGYPHDVITSENLDIMNFNGASPLSVEHLGEIPEDKDGNRRCSCLFPRRAARSTANAGIAGNGVPDTVENRYAQILVDCLHGEPPPPPPSSSVPSDTDDDPDDDDPDDDDPELDEVDNELGDGGGI